ncbi:MAG: PKD domain-containing protein [Thaumarchaeota archaeon]|nr:PKD domain-containing protein [Nitrososphaerota archaeon]
MEVKNGKVVSPPIASSPHYHINVNQRAPQFDAYLTEAVIYKRNSVGLSLSTVLTGDQEQYEGGDPPQSIPWQPRNLNPWIRFENAREDPYLGKFQISGYEGQTKFISKPQNFAVLVYSINPGGSIMVQPPQDPNPSVPQGAYSTTTEIYFQVEVNGLYDHFTSWWDFGDGSPQRSGSLVSHKFKEPKNYQVKCRLTFWDQETGLDNTLTLYTTAFIMNPTQ